MGWPGRATEMRSNRPRPPARRFILPLLAGTWLIVSGCTIERADVRTPSGEPPESDTARVRSVLEGFANAFVAADTAGLDTLLLEGVTVFEDGRAERGWRALLESSQAHGRGARQLLLSDVNIEMAGGQLALATCRYSMTFARDTLHAEQGLATLILERSGAGWLLTHIHLSSPTSSSLPAGEAAGSGPQ